MDNYPPYLAPDLDDSERRKEPFESWWKRVSNNYPGVPVDVARYWLHEHWGHSPYSYLISHSYQFELEAWSPGSLRHVRSQECNYDAINAWCEENGRFLSSLADPPHNYPTAIYMRAHGTFPTPIIVLDNRDGHLTAHYAQAAAEQIPPPVAFVLIEGHRRFNLSLWLQKHDQMNNPVKVWVMRRKI